MTRAFVILVALMLLANPGCASRRWNWLQAFQGYNSDERYVGTSATGQAEQSAPVGQYRQQQQPAN
jgi:hypothetical protein